ncbi:hypothetical protein TcWFU_000865 [Taenia crassiceps]|uniref:Uncharacterized protein n=1 Tax=Taenia crassiceps TaxID=6207 RepID=A0ABR4QF99_9CEST
MTVLPHEGCSQCDRLQQALNESIKRVKVLNCRVTDLKAQLCKLQAEIHQDVMSSEYGNTDLRSELAKKDKENAELKAQLEEVLSRFKDLKIKAERRAKLLHHVMSEYNAMTKEYDILKTETTSLQQRNNEMYDHIVNQDTRIDQLEQNIQVLEAENNELRRSRIIDASTKQWYGECTHSCSKHPRTYPNLAVHGHKGEQIPDEASCPPCETCSEAEAWAQGLMDTAPKFTDSLRKHFQSTLPLRSRGTLPRSMQSTPASTLKKPSGVPAQETPTPAYKVN